MIIDEQGEVVEATLLDLVIKKSFMSNLKPIERIT